MPAARLAKSPRVSPKSARLPPPRLDPKALDVLEEFLSLDLPFADAAAALAGFADAAGLKLDGALSRFDARAAALANAGVDLTSITYRAAFGRPLDYYTGLVFEIAEAGKPAVLAGGGRYDRMLTLLGAKDHIPAVGFSLWLDRIEATRERLHDHHHCAALQGRMKEDASAIFARAGMNIVSVGNDRSYRGRVEGWDDVEIAFLSASEISREVGSGLVDFGVTGEDLMREEWAEVDSRVEFAARLGFGHADVIVAVPEIWLDVDNHGRSRRCGGRLPRPPWPPS